MKKFLKKRAEKLIRSITKTSMDFPPLRNTRNLDPYLFAVLQDLEIKQELNNPAFFMQELRAAFMPYSLKVKEIKQTKGGSDEVNRRFSILVDTVAESLPCLPAPVALKIATVADRHLGNSDSYPAQGADLAWIFDKGSAFSRRGRILYSTVRFMRPSYCVEAGTFFGMSAFYILSALARFSPQGCLHTIEASDIFYAAANRPLKEHFGDKVNCYQGTTQNTLASIANKIPAIDFFFHDNGHSRDHYVRDFNLALEYLKPDSIVLFDDIRWQDKNAEIDPQCYQGWLEIVAHPRVRRAVELDAEMGLMLIG